MKRARFSEEQIVGILKEHEADRKVAELAREHGVSEATLYGWKNNYGGMEVGEAQRLRSLEDENRRLRLTDLGSEVLEHARRSSGINDAIANIASNHFLSCFRDTPNLRSPSISDSVLAPSL
jgi:putative transposase